MSVKRAQSEIDSAEFSEWLARDLIVSGGLARPAPEPVRTDDDLMAQALAWQTRVNARPN